MEEIKKKRIYCFDLLKILAILVIIVYHMVVDMYVVHPMHNLRFIEQVLCGQKVNIALMSTAMFMMLSGAMLALNGKEVEPISFYKKRLIRVLIPFYISYIIYYIIRVFNAGTFRIFGISNWKFIYTILGMDEYLNAHGIKTFSLGVGEWFLGCIILCYLVYPFLYKIHKKNKVLVFFVMTILNILINAKYHLLNLQIASYMNFICQIYNFYLGIVLIDKKVLSKINKMSLFITIPVLIVLFTFKLPIYENIKVTTAVAMVFITFYSLEEIISDTKFLIPIILFFNKISLEIYLVHHFVIYQVNYMLNYRSISGFMTIFIMCIDMVIIILLAVIVEYLSRKVTMFVEQRTKKRN